MSNFPQTIDIGEWSKFLKRELTNDEKRLFARVLEERMLNSAIDNINKCVKDRNLKVCKLTDLHGDCFFESLVILGIGDDSEKLRISISHLMYIFRDYRGFFPDQEETLAELFSHFNEIEYVHCKQTNRIYKYTYNIMCQDMSESSNWNRLPTQLILMFISKIFNLNIAIINDSGFEHNININNNNNNTIYLGHIGECHYVPINIITDKNSDNLEHKENWNKFISWVYQETQ